MPITRLNTFEGVPLGKENFDDYLAYLLQLTARSNPFIESSSSDFNEIIVLGSGQTYSLASSTGKEFSNQLKINNIGTPNLFSYRHSIGEYDSTLSSGITSNQQINVTPASLTAGNYLVRVEITATEDSDRSADFAIQVNSVDVSQTFSFNSSDISTTRYIYHAINDVFGTDTIQVDISNISGSTGSLSIRAVVYEYEDWDYNSFYVLNFDLLNPVFNVNSLTALNVYFENEAVFQSTDSSNFTPIDSINISIGNDSIGSLIFRPDSTDINAGLIFSLRDESGVESELNVSVDSFKLVDTNLITISGGSANSFAFLTADNKELYALETYLIDGDYSTPDVDDWIIPLASIKELDFGGGSTGYGFEKSDLPDSFNRFSSGDYQSAKSDKEIGGYETGFNLVTLNGIPQVNTDQVSSAGFYDTTKLKASDIFHLQSLRLGSEYPATKFSFTDNHQYAREVIEGFTHINSGTGSFGSSSLASLDYNNTLYFPYTDFLLSPSLLLIHYDSSEDSEFYYYIPKEENALSETVQINHYRVVDPSSGEVRFNFNLNISSALDVNDRFWIISAEQLPSNTTNNVTDYFSSYGSLYYPTANLNVDTKIVSFNPSILVDTDLESFLPSANIIPSNKIISSGGGSIISDAEGEYTNLVLYGISYPGRIDVDQFVRIQANKYEPDVLSFNYYCGISAEKVVRDDKPYPTYIKLVENDVSWYNRGINNLTYDPVSRAKNSELCVVDTELVNGSQVAPENSARITDLQRRSSLSARVSTIDASQTTFVGALNSNSFLTTNSSNLITSVAANQGDLLIGSNSSSPSTLAIGANNTFLTSNGITPSWTSTIDISSINVSSTSLVANLNADRLDGEEGTYYLDWDNTTNKPSPRLILSGDASGSVTFSDLQSTDFTLNVTVSGSGGGTPGDASTLDGLDSTEFLRSNVSDQYTSGTLTFKSGTSATFESGSTVNFSNGSTVNFDTVTGNPPFYVDSETVVTFLNADRVDGLQGDDVLRSNANDAYTSGTLSFNSGTTVNFNSGSTVNFDNTTGTSPFTVDSTTLVSNLNAERLNSQLASYYLNTSSTSQTKSGDLKANNLYTNEYIYHEGDGDTYIQFTTDKIDFAAGGSERLQINSTGVAVTGTLLIPTK